MKQDQFIRGLKINKIRNNPLIYNYLRENSYEYQGLYRDKKYIKEIEKKAKIKYKETIPDKIEKLTEKINLLESFMSIMK